MKSVAILIFLACLAFSQARFLEDDYDSESEDSLEEYESFMDYSDLDHKGHGGHCLCCPHGCWCHGMDDGLRVSVTFMVDETVQKESATEVIADIVVDKDHFSKKFVVNKLDDFCEKVEGKDVCFDFDIKDKKPRARRLKGCVKLTKPQEVDLGCFKLPLLDGTGYDVTGSEMESESESEMYDDETLYFKEY